MACREYTLKHIQSVCSHSLARFIKPTQYQYKKICIHYLQQATKQSAVHRQKTGFQRKEKEENQFLPYTTKNACFISPPFCQQSISY